ncbi:MAG: glucose/mannose-6-phosphate isomerase [Clostridia bacterium]|nr:glucose/mannose-6-phosphate isomerase [Clostridia bacterium]
MYIDLDDLPALTRLDSARALEDTVNYSRQFKKAWQLAREWPGDFSPQRIRRILILGTGGGSAAAAALLSAYLFDELTIPLTLNQGYTIPAGIDRNTLAIVISYSGVTREVLAAYEAVKATGAQVAVITAGGELLGTAREEGHPLLVIPGGKMPRVALGYIFLPLLSLLQRLGLIGDQEAAVQETINLLADLAGEYAPDVKSANNLAKTMALEMLGRIPVIYGTLPFTDAVARRWKNQFGENSKLMAFTNSFPALHHDEANGWDASPDHLGHFYFTFLEDAEDGQENSRRIEISYAILSQRAAGARRVTYRGISRLARLFSLVYLGDFVTLYLALARDLDPTPVGVIDKIKRLMMAANTD